MNDASGSSTGDGRDVFVYTGCGAVPVHVTRARVHPSVGEIYDAAFESREGLIEVDLDPCDGLERIGESAFRECKSLRRIVVPPTVKVIGPRAFRGCEGLAEVVLSEGLEEIGESAFWECKSLRRIAVPPTVKVIGPQAFRGCEGLAEVVLSEGLEKIGEYAFGDCKSLERIAIPSTVRRIGVRAFDECTGLLEVVLSEGLEDIEGCAFAKCKSLERIVTPWTVWRIGKGAFSECTGLLEVVLSEELEEIEFWLFLDCKSLERISIPSTARRIGYGAFSGCSGMFSVEMPGDLQEIASEAFRHCKHLRNIAIPPACQVDEVSFSGVDALEVAFSSNSRPTAILNGLRRRFNGLSIHQLCYYQSHRLPNDLLRDIEGEIGETNQPNPTGTQRDCLGMTPLHILACSASQDEYLYRLLLEKYPDNLVAEDKWGGLPILYALWGSAPREVVQLLAEGHKSFPNRVVDWGRMIVALGKGDAPDGIRTLLDVQRSLFPDQCVAWQECAMELASSSDASVETFRLVLRLSVADRLDALGVEKWQLEVNSFISECTEGPKGREAWVSLLYSNLASYEQMKEAGCSNLQFGRARWMSPCHTFTAEVTRKGFSAASSVEPIRSCQLCCLSSPHLSGCSTHQTRMIRRRGGGVVDEGASVRRGRRGGGVVKEEAFGIRTAKNRTVNNPTLE